MASRNAKTPNTLRNGAHALFFAMEIIGVIIIAKAR